MSTKLGGSGKVKAILTVTLDDPATMTPGIIGTVLSRWVSGDVPDDKKVMYDQWVEQLILNHRNRRAIITPQGSHYVDAVAALLTSEGDTEAPRAIAREMAERLCTGGLSVVRQRED